MSNQSSIQGFIHALEQGVLVKWLRMALAIVGSIALALAYLFFQFRGLSTATGMEQAQIARELSRGHGFSTKEIRPLAIQQIKQKAGGIPKENFPDTYHAPLNPLINSLFLNVFKGDLRNQMDNDNPVFSGDRVIAGVSILFFLGSLVINFFLARSLFDQRIAVLGTLFVILADQFWQFSLSGLPQMLLLFLFSAAMASLARAVRCQINGRSPFLWLVFLGLALGLLALAHPLTLWITAGLGLFCMLYFRPKLIAGLVPIILAVAFFVPWIVRDLKVTGAPFGLSGYAWLDGITFTETGWMRQEQTDLSKLTPVIFRHRIQEDVKNQLGNLYWLLGGIVVAPGFFFALLHRFKRPECEGFKWAIALTWLLAFIGQALIGTQNKWDSPNQLLILFGPLMTFFGLALVLILWNRLQLGQSFFLYILVAFLLAVTALPALFSFLPGNMRMQYPPYLPGVMQVFGTWTNAGEVITSDMPWAVGWYSDRKSLWLPYTVKEFNELHDYETLGPIVGMYLTPVSRDASYLLTINQGEYKDWAALLLPIPDALNAFPLRYPLSLANNQCLYYSDRIRWK